MIFEMCAHGTRISFRFHSTWSIVRMTIDSTTFMSTHPISFAENTNTFRCTSSIYRNRISSSGSRNPLPLIRSFFQIMTVNLCLMSTNFRCDGSSETSSSYVHYLQVGIPPKISLFYYDLVLCADHRFFFVECIRLCLLEFLLHCSSCSRKNRCPIWAYLLLSCFDSFLPMRAS